MFIGWIWQSPHVDNVCATSSAKPHSKPISASVAIAVRPATAIATTEAIIATIAIIVIIAWMQTAASTQLTLPSSTTFENSIIKFLSFLFFDLQKSIIVSKTVLCSHDNSNYKFAKSDIIRISSNLQHVHDHMAHLVLLKFDWNHNKPLLRWRYGNKQTCSQAHITTHWDILRCEHSCRQRVRVS